MRETSVRVTESGGGGPSFGKDKQEIGAACREQRKVTIVERQSRETEIQYRTRNYKVLSTRTSCIHQMHSYNVESKSHFSGCSSVEFLIVRKVLWAKQQCFKAFQKQPRPCYPCHYHRQPPIMLSGAQGSLHRIRCHTDQSDAWGHTLLSSSVISVKHHCEVDR